MLEKQAGMVDHKSRLDVFVSGLPINVEPPNSAISLNAMAGNQTAFCMSHLAVDRVLAA